QEIKKWKMSDLLAYMEKSTQPLIINFWATFCVPCVEEIPYFQEITSSYKSDSVILLLISLDLPSFYPEKIAGFAKKHNITAEIIWLNETNADYFCPLIDPRWSGAIPATLFFHGKSGYRKFYEEEISRSKFEAEVKELIKAGRS